MLFFKQAVPMYFALTHCDEILYPADSTQWKSHSVLNQHNENFMPCWLSIMKISFCVDSVLWKSHFVLTQHNTNLLPFWLGIMKISFRDDSAQYWLSIMKNVILCWLCIPCWLSVMQFSLNVDSVQWKSNFADSAWEENIAQIFRLSLKEWSKQLQYHKLTTVV